MELSNNMWQILLQFFILIKQNVLVWLFNFFEWNKPLKDVSENRLYSDSETVQAHTIVYLIHYTLR